MNVRKEFRLWGSVELWGKRGWSGGEWADRKWKGYQQGCQIYWRFVEGEWYGYVGPDDVPALLEQHIGKGEIIDHLWSYVGRYI
ncbi:hypothetical protein KSP40_PGU004605 [Platanthera guangdongensis]|uniref:Uncharacterized protein n=1 Tax=Platanthera guangdongensis TaxID=2320717 RepID=A0ABR2LFT6_9ASPA